MDDLDVDALFELEEIKPHEIVEEHQTSSRGDREHSHAPVLEGDDEEEEREAHEATEMGGSSGSSRDRGGDDNSICLLYTSPSPRDRTRSRMPSSA